MDHYFECDGIPYRVTLMVPLNQTHRTTEPKFQMKCNEWTPAATNSLVVIITFVALVIFFSIFPPILKHFSPFHHSRMVAITGNGLVRFYNIFHRSDPARLTPWPIRESSVRLSSSSSSPSVSSSTRQVLPLTTADSPDSVPATGSTPGRGFFARIKSLCSIKQQSSRSEARVIDVSTTTESREGDMGESRTRSTPRASVVEMAMPTRTTTHTPGSIDTLPPYRI
ncbi:MAG: hypothetical protein J3R72DRAFT_461145 [Linnemannia gamsii]|nr:MAG: hypothetical protein J3R72DRAFT_461145 [Linnemannia gamsii]